MNQDASEATSPKRLVVRYGVTTAVVALAVYVLVESFDVTASLQAVTSADPVWGAAALLSFYVTFPIRTRRWRQFLDNIDVSTDWKSANLVLFCGFYLNIIVPAKLGDVYRAVLAGREYEVPTSTVGGTIASERVLDLTLLAVGVVVLLPIVLSANVESSQRILLGTVGLLTVLLVGGVVLYVFPSTLLPARIETIFDEFRTGLRASIGGSGWDVAEVVGLSLLIWGSNVVRTYFVTVALDAPLSTLEIALLAVLVALLSGLPYVQSGIGIVEVLGPTVLVSIGLTAKTALAVIFLDRFITLVTLLIFGTPIYVYTAHVRPS